MKSVFLLIVVLIAPDGSTQIRNAQQVTSSIEHCISSIDELTVQAKEELDGSPVKVIFACVEIDDTRNL